jgi:hypothetical protein
MLLVEWDGNSHVGDTIAIVVVHARVIRCKFWSFFFLFFFLDSCLTADFSDPGLAAQDVVGFGKVYMRVLFDVTGSRVGLQFVARVGICFCNSLVRRGISTASVLAGMVK